MIKMFKSGDEKLNQMSNEPSIQLIIIFALLSKRILHEQLNISMHPPAVRSEYYVLIIKSIQDIDDRTRIL